MTLAINLSESMAFLWLRRGNLKLPFGPAPAPINVDWETLVRSQVTEIMSD